MSTHHQLRQLEAATPAPSQSLEAAEQPLPEQLLLASSKFYQVSRVLRHLVDTGDALNVPLGELTPFHSLTVPEISIEWYFILLAINSGLQEEQSVVILILIERLCNNAFENQTPLSINSLSAHR